MKLLCYGTLTGEALQHCGRPARMYGRLWDNGLVWLHAVEARSKVTVEPNYFDR